MNYQIYNTTKIILYLDIVLYRLIVVVIKYIGLRDSREKGNTYVSNGNMLSLNIYTCCCLNIIILLAFLQKVTTVICVMKLSAVKQNVKHFNFDKKLIILATIIILKTITMKALKCKPLA